MILYIADLHFGHRNVIRMDHRPFVDVDEMDHCMIELWNARVFDTDEVYIIGDFCYHAPRPPQWYLRQLKGRKHFVFGNHDAVLKKNNAALSCFESVQDIVTIQDGDKQVVLCHYPLAEWPYYFRNAYHVYGHIHNNKNRAYDIMKEEKRALNAGCMINGYAPASLKELIENNRRFQEM